MHFIVIAICPNNDCSYMYMPEVDGKGGKQI